jgi:hypothetical protein
MCLFAGPVLYQFQLFPVYVVALDQVVYRVSNRALENILGRVLHAHAVQRTDLVQRPKIVKVCYSVWLDLQELGVPTIANAEEHAQVPLHELLSGIFVFFLLFKHGRLSLLLRLYFRTQFRHHEKIEPTARLILFVITITTAMFVLSSTVS